MLKPAQILQGRYQLQQQLANNAGRQTWLAQDLNSSPPEPVIVKLLAFSPQMQWDEFKLFEREAAVLKQLNHPQIPNYRDYFSLDKEIGARLYWFGLVQEYIPGKSLQQLLDQGYHFSETQVRSIATQVLKILQYLHGLKPPVLHRDIKPNNLILGRDKRVYLVDFGAVQNSAAIEGVTFTVVGTSGYAPLEQFWGQAVAASDLYALGASLIHLLTGISPADLPQRELRIQFRDKVSINPQFLNWIEALSEPDLGLRFKTASQALKKLKQGYLIKDNTPRIKPPASSKIKIDKSVADQLSITIPAKPMLLLRDLFGFALKIAPLIGTYILIMLIAIMFILIIPLGPYLVTLLLSLLISLGILMNIDFAFLILILSTTKMVFVVKKTMFSFKEWWLKFKRNTCKSIMNDIKRTSFVSLNSYRIQFDREGLIFECCKNYILFKMYDQPTKRNTRKTKLENTNYYNSYLQELTVNSDCHQIYLKTLTDTYTIRGLSQAECKWILKEIQTWLDQCQ